MPSAQQKGMVITMTIKKTVLAVLSIVLVLSMLPLSVFAAPADDTETRHARKPGKRPDTVRDAMLRRRES